MRSRDLRRAAGSSARRLRLARRPSSTSSSSIASSTATPATTATSTARRRRAARRPTTRAATGPASRRRSTPATSTTSASTRSGSRCPSRTPTPPPATAPAATTTSTPATTATGRTTRRRPSRASARSPSCKALVDRRAREGHDQGALRLRDGPRARSTAPIYPQNPSWFWPNRNNGDCICGQNCNWNAHAQRCWFADYLPHWNYTVQAARDYSVERRGEPREEHRRRRLPARRDQARRRQLAHAAARADPIADRPAAEPAAALLHGRRDVRLRQPRTSSSRSSTRRPSSTGSSTSRCVATSSTRCS